MRIWWWAKRTPKKKDEKRYKSVPKIEFVKVVAGAQRGASYSISRYTGSLATSLSWTPSPEPATSKLSKAEQTVQA